MASMMTGPERRPLFEDEVFSSNSRNNDALFDEDIQDVDDGGISKKHGILDRYDFVLEQQKTLVQLQLRSSQSRARNTSAPSPHSPPMSHAMPKDSRMDILDLDPLIECAEDHTNSVSKHVGDQTSSNAYSVSKQLLDEGEDPLSAPPSSPPFHPHVARRSSMWTQEGEMATPLEVSVDDIKRNPFEEDTDDADTTRRSRRLAFSLTIFLPHNDKLGMSISMLKDGSVAVTKLESASNGDVGLAEAGGLRIHDRLLGANFQPFCGVLSSVVSMLDTAKTNDVLYLQVLRDPLICNDKPSVAHFPLISRLLALVAKLEKKGVTTVEEARVMRAAVLGIMARQEERLRLNGRTATREEGLPFLSPVKNCIEKLCLRAKGIREAICVRTIDSVKSNDKVMYELRVEDVESGTWWIVSKRYRNFATLHTELSVIWPQILELSFPVKIIASNLQPSVIEERVVGLELFIREALSLLTQYACMVLPASRALRLLQEFLLVPEHIDEVDAELIHEQMLPPAPVANKAVELTAFFYLENDAQVRAEADALVASFHGNSIIEKCNSEGGGGHEVLFKEVALRIEHLHCFISDLHRGSLDSTYKGALQARLGVANESSPAESEDTLATETHTRDINRAIRRQCEASMYVPLRRFIFDGAAHLEKKSVALQRRLEALLACGSATTAVLQLPENIPGIAPIEWATALVSVRRLCAHYLPCDMVDSLCTVSQSIVNLHGIVCRSNKDKTGQSKGSHQRETNIKVNVIGVDEERDSTDIDQIAMSADDFLPLLTIVIIHASPPNLLIVSEICAHLLDPEESIAERGYYVASLQAAVNISMNIQVEGHDLDQPMPDPPRIRKRDIFINKVSRLSFAGP